MIACTVPAVPSVGTAAAILATRAGAAGTPVRQGNTGFSVRTGELGAAGGIQQVPRGYSQTLGGGGKVIMVISVPFTGQGDLSRGG